MRHTMHGYALFKKASAIDKKNINGQKYSRNDR